MTEYKFVKPVGEFNADDLAAVTARYGEWHMYDLRLTAANDHLTTSVELTEATFETATKPVSETEAT